MLSSCVDDLIAAVGNFLDLVDQLFVDIHELIWDLGDLAKDQDLLEEELTIVQEKLLSEFRRETLVDQILYVFFLLKQVIDVHLIEVTPDIIGSILQFLLAPLHLLLRVRILQANLIQLLLSIHIVQFKLLDIALLLLLLWTGHLINDLDDAVQEEDEKEHHDEDGDVGEDYWDWVAGRDVAVADCAHCLEWPVYCVVQPDVPLFGILLDDVSTVRDSVLHLEGTHGEGKPVLRASVCLIHIEPVIDIEEDRWQPYQDKQHVCDQPCELVRRISVRLELYLIDDKVIDLEDSPHISIEEQLQKNKIRCLCNRVDEKQKNAEDIQETFDAEIVFHYLLSIGDEVAQFLELSIWPHEDDIDEYDDHAQPIQGKSDCRLNSNEGTWY